MISGTLEHRDGTGQVAVLQPGDVQRISAGTGFLHAEFNASPIEPAHYLQIWILPDREQLPPDCAVKSFGEAPTGRWHVAASKLGRDDSLRLNQYVEFLLARLGPGEQIFYQPNPGRHAWIHIAAGAIVVNGAPLQAGDGAAISDEPAVTLTCLVPPRSPGVPANPAQILLFDML